MANLDVLQCTGFLLRPRQAFETVLDSMMNRWEEAGAGHPLCYTILCLELGQHCLC